jgi:hypothetical protein
MIDKNSESKWGIGHGPSWGEILPSRKHQPYPRSVDHDRITKARQAAEALFTSKPPVSRSGSTVDVVDETARKPRVLPIISRSAPILSDEPETSIIAAPPPSEIPRSQFARIRAWVKYGLTVAQVAQVYGVSVAEIERLLRHT